MDVWHRCCAGFDVHKRTVVACVQTDDRVSKSIKAFADLLALSDRLAAQLHPVASHAGIPGPDS